MNEELSRISLRPIRAIKILAGDQSIVEPKLASVGAVDGGTTAGTGSGCGAGA